MAAAESSSSEKVTKYTINKKFLFVVKDILTKKECTDLIAYMESKPHKQMRGRQTNYDRVIYISDEWAECIYSRVIDILPKGFREEIDINTYFRFSKYYPGGFFRIHSDGINQNKDGKRTIMTINIFLNNECEGGSTTFYSDDRKRKVISVKPEPGTCAIFDRRIQHCGDRVTSGIKYLFRTDVMQ
jgi:Rps23 Pro-64 3,4-dihydroxylase Tpa1-like proline 4-hydroxylase